MIRYIELFEKRIALTANAVNDTYTLAEDTVLVVSSIDGLLANDFDVDGDSLTAIVLTQPANGILNVNADGSFVYQPNTGFVGADSFLYLASDGVSISSATVSLSINPDGESSNAKAIFFGPLPYTSVNDSPVEFESGIVENFEDGRLDSFIELSTGTIIGPTYSSGLPLVTDSVDADDGIVDGSGQSNSGGHSWYAAGNQITVQFSEVVQSAGLVWTDGDVRLVDVVFEAFDGLGESLGTLNGGDLSDPSYQGTTVEDRFFGVVYGDGIQSGISRLSISNVGGLGIEIDHIRYLKSVDGILAALLESESPAVLSQMPATGDANRDGTVGFADFLILSASFGSIGSWEHGDFNSDGQINFADFLLLSQGFGAD